MPSIQAVEGFVLDDADESGLERFADAQHGTYEQALREMQAGEKRSHWMWFIFPQVRGLGASSMAQRYGIAGLAEAQAYLQYPVLGSRLREITAAVNRHAARPVREIFGYPDDLKFHSSMTLFAEAAKAARLPGDEFQQALGQWFAGQRDAATLRLLLSA